MPHVKENQFIKSRILKIYIQTWFSFGKGNDLFKINPHLKTSIQFSRKGIYVLRCIDMLQDMAITCNTNAYNKTSCINKSCYFLKDVISCWFSLEVKYVWDKRIPERIRVRCILYANRDWQSGKSFFTLAWIIWHDLLPIQCHIDPSYGIHIYICTQCIR